MVDHGQVVVDSSLINSNELLERFLRIKKKGKMVSLHVVLNQMPHQAVQAFIWSEDYVMDLVNGLVVYM